MIHLKKFYEVLLKKNQFIQKSNSNKYTTGIFKQK